MPSTFSPNLNLELQATGENNGTWGIKLDAVLSQIDLAAGGRLSLSVAGNSDVTLNATQLQPVRHSFTGALTGNINVVYAAGAGRFYLIQNSTSGAFTLTVKPSGGAGVVIPQGVEALVFMNPDTAAAELVASSQSNGPGPLLNLPTAGGTANAITATYSPAVTTLAAGQVLAFVASASNTSAATFSPNGLTAKAITKLGATALVGGEIQSGAIVVVAYDGTQWQLIGSYFAARDGTQFYGGTSGGSANAQTVTLTEAPAAYKAGMIVDFIAGFANTGSCTINVNGLGAKNVTKYGNQALVGGEIVSGEVHQIVYDGTQFELLNPGPSAIGLAIYAGTSSGAANTYAITPAPAIAGYVAGQIFLFKSHQTSTGSVTVNVNGLGSKNLWNWSGALTNGEIQNGQMVLIVYDGTQFRLLSTFATSQQARGYAQQQWFQEATLTDAATIAWDVNVAQAATVTLGGNRTLGAPSNMQAGATYILRVKQDGTGSRTLAYNAVFKWPGGSAPVLSTAAGATDILTFYSDGTSMFGTIQKAFS